MKKRGIFSNNLGDIRIQKSTSRIYVKNLVMNYAILKLKLSVKVKINISAADYTY